MSCEIKTKEDKLQKEQLLTLQTKTGAENPKPSYRNPPYGNTFIQNSW